MQYEELEEHDKDSRQKKTESSERTGRMNQNRMYKRQKLMRHGYIAMNQYFYQIQISFKQFDLNYIYYQSRHYHSEGIWEICNERIFHAF